MADDVRSMILYLHENEVVVDPVTGEGFFLDPVFTESCEDQMEMRDQLNLPADAVTPTVSITAAPSAITTATDATFAFTTTDSISDLCVLDSGAIERCLSPKTYTGLEPGTHTFTVIAMGAGAGNFVSDTHTWTILPLGEDTPVVSLNPVRFADTRPGWVAADGLFFGTGPVPAGGVVQVPIAGSWCRADRRRGGGCQRDVGECCRAGLRHGVPVRDGAWYVERELSGRGQ
jgi:hypothetical protein